MTFSISSLLILFSLSHYFLPALEVLDSFASPVIAPTRNNNLSVFTPQKFGAVGDGITDDSEAIARTFAAAIAAGNNNTVSFPAPLRAYRIRRQITINGAVNIQGNLSRIFFDFPASTDTSNGSLFRVISANVSFDKLWIDGAGVTATPAGNRRAIYVEGAARARLKNIKITNSKFTNLLPFQGNKPEVILYSTPISAFFTDDFEFSGNTVETVSGWGVFLESVSRAKILNNSLRDTGMASIELYDDNHFAEIAGNTITGTGEFTRYWGGSIDLLSQHSGGLPINTDISVTNNFISGKHMYGAAIRTGSISNLLIGKNQIQDIDGSYSSICSYINVTTRGDRAIDMSQRGLKNITITENTMIAGGTNAIGIYVSNPVPKDSTGMLPVGENLTITGNKIFSKDAGNYFINGIVVHGNDKGWKTVRVKDNQITAKAAPNSVVAGMIAAVTYDPQVSIEDLEISGNNCTYFDNSGKFPAAGSSDIGIQISHVRKVTMGQNTVRKAFRGIHNDAVHNQEVKGLNLNRIESSVNADIVGATPTIMLGAGAGTGATVSIEGDENSGEIKFQMGQKPAPNAFLFQIEWPISFTGTVRLSASRYSKRSADSAGTAFYEMRRVSSQIFQLPTPSLTFAEGAFYRFNYQVIK